MHALREIHGRSKEVCRSLSNFQFAIVTGKAAKCLVNVFVGMPTSQKSDAHRPHIGAGYLESGPSESEIIFNLAWGVVRLYVDVILSQVEVVLRGQEMQCMAQRFHRSIAVLHGVRVRKREEHEIAMDQSQGNV